MNLLHYNGILLKIKTDGKSYKVILKMDSFNDKNHPSFAFVVDKSKEWQTLVLPLSIFCLDKYDFSDKTTLLGQSIYDKCILRSFGIIYEGNTDESFEFSLKEIALIHNPEFYKI